jgi:hypothetical protein
VVTAISVVLVGHRSDQNQRGKRILPRLQLGEVHQRLQGPYEAGRGPARPRWSGAAPDSAARGRGGARNANFVQRPYEAGDGPAGRDGRGRHRIARLDVAAGRGMRSSRKDPMKRGTGRRGRDGRAAPDGAARGRGRARNAIFVQRPYEAGDGPAGPGWSGSAPDGAARGRGRARNAIFAQRPYEAGDGVGMVAAPSASSLRASTPGTSPRAGLGRSWRPKPAGVGEVKTRLSGTARVRLGRR